MNLKGVWVKSERLHRTLTGKTVSEEQVSVVDSCFIFYSVEVKVEVRSQSSYSWCLWDRKGGITFINIVLQMCLVPLCAFWQSSVLLALWNSLSSSMLISHERQFPVHRRYSRMVGSVCWPRLLPEEISFWNFLWLYFKYFKIFPVKIPFLSDLFFFSHKNIRLLGK